MKPKIQEAAAGVFTAFSDALQGDMRKLTMLGTFIGEVIGAGIKIGLTRAQLEIGQGFFKTLEDINPIRNYLMSEEAKGKNKISEYIASGKSSVTSGQVEDAITDIMKNYSALMQGLNQTQNKFSREKISSCQQQDTVLQTKCRKQPWKTS